jgi:hypothetical protein
MSTSGADPARSPPPERGSHQPTRPTRLEDSNLRAEQDWVCPSLAARVMHGGRTIGAAAATAGDGTFVRTAPAASGIDRGSVPLWLRESCAAAGQSVPPLQLLATVCSFEPHLRPRASIEGLSLFGCESHVRRRDNRCRRCNCWRRCVRWNRTCGLGDRSRVCPSVAARVMCGGGTIGAAVATAGDGVFVGTAPAASEIARGSVPLWLPESCAGAGQSVSPLQLLGTVCSLEPYRRPQRSIEGLSLFGCESHARGPDNRCRRGNCWRWYVRSNRTCGLGDRSRVCPSVAARVMCGGGTIGAAVATAGDGVFV